MANTATKHVQRDQKEGSLYTFTATKWVGADLKSVKMKEDDGPFPQN